MGIKMKFFQKGFNYSQDGPGNRLVYHVQGCNFRCKWCANPEGMEIHSGSAKNYNPLEILEECQRSKMMFFDGGGVTFTGGEPTLQFNELLEILRLLKENNIHTAIENNGSSTRLTELISVVDYFIIDFKHYDNNIHKKWTFSENIQALNNIDKFLESGRQIHVRIPLINGFNCNPEGFAQFFKGKNTKNLQIELLPYHEYGKCKWNKKYEIIDGFISSDTLKNFYKVLRENGLNVI